jgi:diguanylate cyclase (GGDEF)-like protein/PAS domain S-box-containing protein
MIDVTQQKNTELELVRSEIRYSLATRGSNDGIWYWDLRTDALHVSGRFHQILGLDSRDHVYEGGWGFLEQLIDREDRVRVQEAYRRHLSGNSAKFSVDFREFHGDGRLVWVNWRGLAEFEDGVPVRMAGSLSDLAERGSSYDTLTNLPGRPLFRDRLSQLIALHQTEAVNGDGPPTRSAATMFAVLLLDLNGFKAVNDSYGHHVGDQLLQQVARRLESCVRAVDLVARMSGDEFNVLLESIDPAEASHRAQQIAAALAAPYVIGEHTVISGASVGLVSSASRLATVDDYLRAADTAMYRAKSQSLGVCVFQ